MRSYRTLRNELHRGSHSSMEALHQQRTSSEAVIHWDFPVGEHTLYCMVTPTIVELLETVYQAELSVQKQWQQLPPEAQSHYLRSLLLDEVVATNDIEGVFSTRKEIQEALNSAIPNHRFKEFARLYDALAHGEAHLPDTLEGIRNLYEKVMDGEKLPDGDQLDGELFRDGPVTVWDSRRQRAVHSGFHPEHKLQEGLREVLRITDRENLPSLITAFIAHLMFEVVHTFYDGNGRTGRYLLGAHIAEILSPATALTLSAAMNTQKDRYYKAFTAVEDPVNRAEATPFVVTMLRILTEAQQELAQDVDARLYLMKSLDAETQALQNKLPTDWKALHVEIMHFLGELHLFGAGRTATYAGVAQHMKRSTGQTRKDLQLLREQGYLDAVTERPVRLRLSDSGLEVLGLRML